MTIYTSPRTRRLVVTAYILAAHLGLLGCAGLSRPQVAPAPPAHAVETVVAQQSVQTTLGWVYEDLSALKGALVEDDLLSAFPERQGYIRGLLDTIKVAGYSMTGEKYEPPADILAKDIAAMSGHLKRLVDEIDQIVIATTRTHLRQYAKSALTWSRIAEQQARRAELIQRVGGQ